MTSYFFSWPRNLESYIATAGDQTKAQAPDLRQSTSRWKLKVYDFRNYGMSAKENELGERLSSKILDYLLQKQLEAKKGTFGDALTSFFLSPSRGDVIRTDDMAAVKQLAPVIMVYGYVDSTESNGISVQIRVNRIDVDLDATPLINRSMSLKDQTDLETAALSIGEEIYHSILEMPKK